MEKDRLIYLYYRYLDHTCTSMELAEFQVVLSDPHMNDLIKEILDEELDMMSVTDLSDVSVMRAKHIFNEITRNEANAKKVIPLRKIVLVAASILLVLGFGYYFYTYNVVIDQFQTAFKNDVAPGKNAATLLLGNGRRIRLDDAQNGVLAKESGIVISKSKDGQLIYEIRSDSENANQTNTLSTANGETYQVRLQDGSIVWLNSASSLTYSPTLLVKGKRHVQLTGEGFFVVAKDSSHPFIVQTGNQEVEVLGTHFNINSYQNEPIIATTLIEGSVKVSSDANQKLIHPGEQVVNEHHSLSVKAVNVEQIIDWKEGDFNLTGVDFRAAMRKIARWYDVEIVYDPSVPTNIQADGWISRTQKLSAVLDMIEKLGIVQFRIEGRKVYISR